MRLQQVKELSLERLKSRTGRTQGSLAEWQPTVAALGTLWNVVLQVLPVTKEERWDRRKVQKGQCGRTRGALACTKMLGLNGMEVRRKE